MTITRPGFAPVDGTSREPAPAAGALRRGGPRLAVVVTLALLGAMVGDAHAETAPPARPSLIHLTRFDAWYGLATVAAVGGASLADDWFRERATASDGTAARRLARAVRPLGAPEVLGPALLLGYLGARALDRPGLTAATVRVGASVVIAGAAAEGLKIAVGRVRPIDIAGETDHFQPFSDHDSFPSGHATLAFASATALDRETAAGWVPWVAYPLAGLVGWSRVRDDVHWTSDVVAGAALGYWIARKTEDAFRIRAERSERLGIVLAPARLGARVGF